MFSIFLIIDPKKQSLFLKVCVLDRLQTCREEDLQQV